jgi:hypothetical protein
MLRARSLFRILQFTLLAACALSGATWADATAPGAAAVVAACLILGQREAERDVWAEPGVLEWDG